MRKPAAAFRSQPAGPAQLKLSTPPNQPKTARLRTRSSLQQSSHLISHTRSLTEIHPSLHKHQIFTLVLSAPHPVLPFQPSYRPAPSAISAISALSVRSAHSSIRPSRPFCAFPLLRQSQRDCVPEPKVGLRHEGLPWVHPQQIPNPNVGCVPKPHQPIAPPPPDTARPSRTPTPRPRSASPIRPNPSAARLHSRPPHNLTPLHHSPSPPHQSYLSILAPSFFSLLTSHFLSRVLLPGLFNHRDIGWLVPRSRAPLNVRPWLSMIAAHAGENGKVSKLLSENVWIRRRQRYRLSNTHRSEGARARFPRMMAA
jgi:hypothetical protein